MIFQYFNNFMFNIFSSRIVVFLSFLFFSYYFKLVFGFILFNFICLFLDLRCLAFLKFCKKIIYWFKISLYEQET